MRVKRELEGGWFQHVAMPLPALLTIQSGINRLRYATLMGIKKAKTKEVTRLTAAELGVAPADGRRSAECTCRGKSKQTADLRRRREGSGGATGGETAVSRCG